MREEKGGFVDRKKKGKRIVITLVEKQQSIVRRRKCGEESDPELVLITCYLIPEASTKAVIGKNLGINFEELRLFRRSRRIPFTGPIKVGNKWLLRFHFGWMIQDVILKDGNARRWELCFLDDCFGLLLSRVFRIVHERHFLC